MSPQNVLSLEQFCGATSAPSPGCWQPLLHCNEQMEQLLLPLLRPGQHERERTGKFQRHFPGWGWETAPKHRFIGEDLLVEFRAGVFGWCDPCGLSVWIIYGICENREIILYFRHSNPAFWDLTSAQILWFYTELILCDLIRADNRFTLG